MTSTKTINERTFRLGEVVQVKEADGTWKGKIASFRVPCWVILKDVTYGEDTLLSSALHWRNENSICKLEKVCLSQAEN